MLEVIRKAARKVNLFYQAKYDYPHLNIWAGEVPERYQKFIGFRDANVMMCGDMVTIVRSSNLEGIVGGVPYGPWNQPGGLNSVPRDISHTLKALEQAPIIASVGFGQDAGRELCYLAKVKPAGKFKWSTFHLTCTAKRQTGGGEGRQLRVDLDEQLKECAELFSCLFLAEHTKAEDIYLKTGVTGALMSGYPGILEYRGSSIPLLLRNEERDMISIIQPAPPPSVAIKLTEEDIYNQSKLPGLWNEKLEKLSKEAAGKEAPEDEGGDDEGEGDAE